jgi:DNA polymerase-3 subunit gamma/tau
MNLALKYRPDSFQQVKGNEEIITSLTKMLSDKTKCPHSFLLTGPTGCGKTTLARIIANQLGCSGMDFKELNTADMRGIDTIRDIIKNSTYKPIESECIVYLIDEAHKLTNDAQNALLKRLEEPSPYLYFILATTEPQKLIDTIKGRCVSFAVKTLNESQLMQLLRRVVREENETLEKEVFEQIVLDSLGHPRNALNILETVLASPVENRLEAAKKTAEKQSQSIELCRALLKPGVSWKEISLLLNGLTEQEPEEIRRHILGYCQAVLLKGENDRAAVIIESLWESLYYIGRPGLVFQCYNIVKS